MSMKNSEAIRLWMAMEIGPYWIGRDDEDPLSPAAIAQDESVQRSQEVTQASSSTQPKQATVSAKVALVPQEQIPQTPQRVQFSPTQRVTMPPSATVKRIDASAPAKEPDSETIARIHTANWQELGSMVASCQLCPTLVQNRLSTVFGTAEPTARMVIVGEAPGRDEDLQGKPFVGKSGELLENILRACGLKRGSDVAIINVLKCRPPNNRDPQDDEIRACSHFLRRQLEILNPTVIVLASRFAAQKLLNTELSTGKLRGSVHKVEIAGRSVPAVVTYHPSYLLRSPVAKNDAWRDFCAAKDLLVQSA